MATDAGARAFDVLRRAVTDRLAAAREAHRAGVGVVGLIGNTIPVEFVLATGRLPVLIAPDVGQPTPTADLYMEDSIAPETRSLFEQAVQGAYEFLELLVLSRPYARLYYYLKEVYRLGRGPKIPPLHIYDLMHSRRQAVRAYNWGRTEALLQRLERLAGREITDSQLWAAVALTNHTRALQRRLLEQRWPGAVSGVEAMQALGAGYFLAPDAYAEALRAYLATPVPDPALRDRPRLLVMTAEPLSHVALHRALEAAGGLVVAEDDWWGARAPGQDVPPAGSAREAIFHKYWLDTASPAVYPAEAREAWFKQAAVRPEIDGVIFYLPPSDHQLGWDYPRLKAWLDDHGKPSLVLRSDVAQPTGRAGLEREAAAFVDALQRRAGT
jgi:benzoyl-CoA reductase/2-hydroxyglutaryl-CoA dehydratase subunit BcrC/BadD/HgdB